MRSGGAVVATIEARTIRKIQIRIIPFLLLLYFVAYLDRINIGFAALTMNQELGITNRQFGMLAGIFFLGYFLFEIPSNLLLHRIGARIWIARILLTWGILATLCGLVQTVGQLYVARFLLGAAEAGFFPGVVLYLTYWFRTRERACAIALFLIGLPATTVLGAPLTGFILDQAHWLGVSSWRWVLILEGIPAVICGALSYFVLPARPAEAAFLAPAERQWIVNELIREEDGKAQQLRLSALATLVSPRLWFLVLIYFGMMFGLYTLTFWAPQLIRALSADNSNSFVGFLVMIPNAVGLGAMILVSRHSDRTLERRWHAGDLCHAGGRCLCVSELHTFGICTFVYCSSVLCCCWNLQLPRPLLVLTV